MTFKSVEVLDSVQLTSGGAITADPGEELVIVYGHYLNTTGQPQSYCGSTLGDTMYGPKVFDTNGSEMSDDVDGNTFYIPGAGNHCSEDLLQGQEDDFVIARRAIKGAVPGYVELEDKRDGSIVRIALK